MKLNILLLCNQPEDATNANTITDHILSFDRYSQHKIWIYSKVGDLSPSLDLNRFDVIIVHYSLSLLYEYFISNASKRRLRRFNGLKVLFVQDEYRQINKMVAEIARINFDVLFTCFPEGEIEKIYPTQALPHLTKHNNLTGYIPERLLQRVSLKQTSQREIDVGYRGRTIPFWLGELAFEKYLIAERWTALTNSSQLTMDISCRESDRIYGQKWIDYLSSCKTTLGVESGSSVMDFTGKLEKLINYHQQEYPNDSFYEVQKIYLMDHEGKYKLNQISPRCFEAISLKTVLVLFEGEYSGILTPGRHYIELKKDFSNLADVVALIKNHDYIQNMANVAYEEIACDPRYSYRAFIEKVDEVLTFEFMQRGKCCVPTELEYSDADFQFAIGERSIEVKPECVVDIQPQGFVPHQKLWVRLLSFLRTRLRNYTVLRQLKTFLTQNVKIFNSLLRKIRLRLNF